MKYFAKEGLAIKLNKGVRRVDMPHLEGIITPLHTDRWRPIRHADFVGLIIDRVFDRGLAIRETLHAVSRDGLQYFGVLDVRSKSYVTDHSWIIAAKNSNDRKTAASIVVGCRLFRTNCIAFSGEVRLSLRHTKQTQADIPSAIDACIEDIWSGWSKLDDRMAAYREMPLVDEKMHHVVMQAFERGIISSRDISRVIYHYRKSKLIPDRPTLYGLYAAFLLAMHNLKADSLIETTIKLTALFDKVCELKSVPSNLIQPSLL